MKNTNSCKSKDDLREYEKFNVAHKMLNVEIAKYKVECRKNNIVYTTKNIRNEFFAAILRPIIQPSPITNLPG